MGIQIEGGGKGFVASVSKVFRLNVSSKSNPRAFYISRDGGRAFSIVSHDATAAAGTYVFYFKNNDPDRDFFIDNMSVGGVETALWKTWFVTGTAAGGNALTPINLNRTSGKVALATSRGNDSITGLTAEAQISTMRTGANASGIMSFGDTLILGTGDAIAVEIDTDDGTPNIAEVFFRGYYEGDTT